MVVRTMGYTGGFEMLSPELVYFCACSRWGGDDSCEFDAFSGLILKNLDGLVNSFGQNRLPAFAAD
jgi:hypothetical protein